MFPQPRTIFIFAVFTILVTALIISCNKHDLRRNTTPLEQVIPPGFPTPVYSFGDNPLTVEGFELGRKLFYDGRLSRDSAYPCSSCHQQVAVFGTFQHDRSHGYGGSHTLRNAPALFNLAWQKELHWDGRFKSLYSEAIQPITTHTEMAENFHSIIFRLKNDTAYKRLFRAAYGSDWVTPERILKALAQFTGYITSYNSKYDRFKNGTEAFSSAEQSGYQLYQAKCAVCHPEPLFTNFNFHNIGLPLDPFLNDYGRMMVTGKSGDSLKFKTPSLRNVNLTSNYMHDGRFNTLLQVLNHYSTAIQPGPTLDPLLLNKIPLTATEQSQLVAFLKTLSDSTILTNTRFSSP